VNESIFLGDVNSEKPTCPTEVLEECPEIILVDKKPFLATNHKLDNLRA
jgi:hypothetical protein